MNERFGNGCAATEKSQKSTEKEYFGTKGSGHMSHGRHIVNPKTPSIASVTSSDDGTWDRLVLLECGEVLCRLSRTGTGMLPAYEKM
jgi:hypothetical protein